MVFAIFGGSCTGKSTIADALRERTGAQVFAGKDYLRLAKGEAQAKDAFRALLAERAEGGEPVIFVISEKEHLALLPQGCVRVLVTAALDVVKERFARRMGGTLPPPVARMLEMKNGLFDREPHDVHIAGGQTTTADACEAIFAAAR